MRLTCSHIFESIHPIRRTQRRGTRTSFETIITKTHDENDGQRIARIQSQRNYPRKKKMFIAADRAAAPPYAPTHFFGFFRRFSHLRHRTIPLNRIRAQASVCVCARSIARGECCPHVCARAGLCLCPCRRVRSTSSDGVVLVQRLSVCLKCGRRRYWVKWND